MTTFILLKGNRKIIGTTIRSRGDGGAGGAEGAGETRKTREIFPIPNSQFPIPNSQFSILNSPIPVKNDLTYLF
ncbi:MAG: hypothetical protein F6K41_21365 [Symploca sp. SIO3E6]|nr:hypothetical protein [Caldora sp. SIO3E6]